MNPLVEEWFLEDVGFLIGSNNTKLRNHLQIRIMREYIEEAIQL